MGTTRRSGIVVGVLLAALLSACSGGTPTPDGDRSAAPSPTATPALTASAFAEVLADYDERNNAAIVGTRTDDDPRAWADADDEVLLDVDRFQTRLLAVTKDPDPPVTLRTTPDELYAPVAEGYPQVVGSVVRRERLGAPADSSSGSGFALWTRESADSPWRSVLSTGLPEGVQAPKAAAPGTASTPTAQDRERALTVADGLVAWLEGGKKPSGVAVDEILTGLRDGTSIRSTDPLTHRLSVRYANDAEDQTANDGSVRVVRTADGALAFVSLLGRDSFSVGQGSFLRWDEPYGTAVEQVGPRSDLSRDIGVMVVVALPAKGDASVLSSAWNTTL